MFLLLFMILVTPIAVILDVPVYREILGFAVTTIIPGLLILKILRNSEIELFKNLVLAIGLSIFLLMGCGLAINFILALANYEQPLASAPLIIGLTIFTLLLWIIAFIRIGDRRYKSDEVLKQRIHFTVIWSVGIPLLFPLLSILGSQIMNSTGNNFVLMTMIVFIAIYIISLGVLRKSINEFAYPLAVLMIGMSLLLMRGLTSHYLIGVDLYAEYSTFKPITNSFNWNIINLDNLRGCLSVSLLPVLYKSIMGVSDLVIPKVVYMLLASIIPLSSYYLFKKYVGPFYAFLTALFLIFQLPFLYDISNNMRMAISLLYFTLTFLIYFTRETEIKQSNVLLLIFIIGTIVSYYAIPVIMLGILFVTWIVPLISKKISLNINRNFIVFTIASIFIFFWWSQITHTAFSDYVNWIKSAIENIGLLFKSNSKELTQAISLFSGSFVDKTVSFTQLFSFLMIGVGALSVFISTTRRKIDPIFAIALLTATGMMILVVVVPYISKGYNGLRLYVQLLGIISPAFIIGLEKSVSFLKQQFRNIVLAAMVVFIGLCNLFFIYQVSGVPYSESLNTNGVRHGVYFVYDGEVEAAYWLQNRSSNSSNVYIDFTSYGGSTGGFFLFTSNLKNELHVFTGLFKNKLYQRSGYMFLRYVNIRDKLAYDNGTISKPIKISNYEDLLIKKIKVYASNEAEIYR